MKVGYGYRKQADDLRAAGADEVWIDLDSARRKRAEMMAVGLRAGDVLVLLYLRDLGGSPVADRVWREKVEALGVTVEIAGPGPSRPIGRPREFWPDAKMDAQLRAIWLNGNDTEQQRLLLVATAFGAKVGRGALNHRYGNPTNPKP